MKYLVELETEKPINIEHYVATFACQQHSFNGVEIKMRNVTEEVEEIKKGEE